MTNVHGKRLLITGVSGLLGSNLAYCLRDDYEVCGLYHTHELDMDKVSAYKCDLRERPQVEEVMRSLSPDIVVHCAAQTNVEDCEGNPEKTEQINVSATRNIVDSLSGRPVKLVYISTDLVYDGIKGNFSEDDPAVPANVYARSKLGGEKEVLKVPGALVLRTNFFGWSVFKERSLGEWVISNLKAQQEIKGFTDSKFSAIYTFDLAELMDEAIQKDLSGIYNLGSGSSLSKYDFAITIAGELGLNADLVTPTSIDNFGFKARRSKDLSLVVSKLENDAGRPSVLIERSIERFTGDFRAGKLDEFHSFARQRIKG
ncbi:MAG: SDR family oxidoreductase [Candidatus Omnitrophica bacterium]|nr:SDR family oxidoreductase [Candidatus Omnitrophota bacterium]